jgi:endonuclease-3 related protein
MRSGGAGTAKIRQIFRQLEAAMGAQHWWPAGSAFEVVLGAYLTQNTAWTNVELAISNLKQANALSAEGVRRLTLAELEQLVRPAGYFRQKAARLKLFVANLDEHHEGSLEKMFAQPTETLRKELLGLTGIGPETADSIMLYAAGHETFVVDSYTRRIFERHGLITVQTTYEEIRLAVQTAFTTEDAAARCKPSAPLLKLPRHSPSEASLMQRSPLAQSYNEFHALLVQTAKHFCLKSEARCSECPIRELLPSGRPQKL